MKTLSKILVILVLGEFILNLPAFGDLSSRFVGMEGANFLKIGTSSRVEGMGGAFCALSDDINSIRYNPAGLAGIELIESTFSYLDWIDDVSIQYLAYAQPLSYYGGAIGGSLTLLRVPAFAHYNSWGENIGNLDFFNFALTLGYARNIRNFPVGANLKYLYQKIVAAKKIAVAMDWGTVYRFEPFILPISRYKISIENLRIGFVIENLGTKAGGDSLPLNIKNGYAFNLRKDLTMVLDINKPIYKLSSFTDSDYKLNLGVEYLFKNILFLRAGYKFGYDTNSWTIGSGIKSHFDKGEILFDYAYASHGYLEKTNRISLSAKLEFPLFLFGEISLDDRNRANMLYYQGIACYDNLDKAIELWKKVLKINPRHEGAKKKLEKALRLKKLEKME